MPCYQKGEQIPSGLVTREYATTPVAYSSKLTCEENCQNQCGTPSVAGGAGVTTDLYYFGPEAMDLPFYYQAYTVPDRFTVTALETGEVLFDLLSGLAVGEPDKLVLIRKPHGPSIVSVVVSGPEGTGWTYRLDCPSEGRCCVPNPADPTKPDCIIAPRAECLRLGGQYCGECTEQESALDPTGCSNALIWCGGCARDEPCHTNCCDPTAAPGTYYSCGEHGTCYTGYPPGITSIHPDCPDLEIDPVTGNKIGLGWYRCPTNPTDPNLGCCSNWSNPYCCGGEPGDNPLP